MDSQENILETGINEEQVNQAAAAPEVVETQEAPVAAEATEVAEAPEASEAYRKVYETKKEVLERVKEIAHGEDAPLKDEVDYLKTTF